MSGHLPTLEGFVLVGEHPLTRYQRAFYQCTAQVGEGPAGSLVRVSANITAWFERRLAFGLPASQVKWAA